MDAAPLFQPGRAGRRPTRRLLGQRAELGLPHIQLERNDGRRLPMVDAAPGEDGRILRRIPHRPHSGLLPNMGDTGRCRPRTAGPVCACTRHDPRGDCCLRTAGRHRPADKALHHRQRDRGAIRRKGRRGALHLCMPPGRRLRHEARIRHAAQGGGRLRRKTIGSRPACATACMR